MFLYDIPIVSNHLILHLLSPTSGFQAYWVLLKGNDRQLGNPISYQNSIYFTPRVFQYFNHKMKEIDIKTISYQKSNSFSHPISGFRHFWFQAYWVLFNGIDRQLGTQFPIKNPIHFRTQFPTSLFHQFTNYF